jgi:hypothetical protein
MEASIVAMVVAYFYHGDGCVPKSWYDFYEFLRRKY